LSSYKVREFYYYKQYGENRTMINKTAPRAVTTGGFGGGGTPKKSKKGVQLAQSGSRNAGIAEIVK
jgi:hypothetical protein